jgi:hypothetical protein
MGLKAMARDNLQKRRRREVTALQWLVFGIAPPHGCLTFLSSVFVVE